MLPVPSASVTLNTAGSRVTCYPTVQSACNKRLVDSSLRGFSAAGIGAAGLIGVISCRFSHTKRCRGSRGARDHQVVIVRAGQSVGVVSAKKLAKPYALVVIGGGPAGVSAAMKGALLGRRVLLVDNPKVPPLPSGLDISFGGPTGLWSKALRDTAKKLDIKTLASMGLDKEVIWKQVKTNCIKLATQNASYQVQRCDDYRVNYLQGIADISEPGKVTVELPDGSKADVTTDNLLLATGSAPMRIGNVPFDDVRIFDSDSINKLDFLPRTVVVVGSGIIAIEYAEIFQKLGAQVTMIIRSEAKSALSRIGLDRDVAEALIDNLRSDGVTLLEGCEVTDFVVPQPEDMSEPVTLKLSHKSGTGPETLKCDVYLAAMGRKPNVKLFEQLGCELVKKGGAVKVDGNFQTTVPGIYAVGDSIGAPGLASTGEYQAQVAVERIFEGSKDDKEVLQFPVGVWTIPEISYYGYTVEKAREQGILCEEGSASYSSCLRGRVFAPDGLLKLVFRTEDGAIIGVHVWGTDACELVHLGMYLVKNKNTIFDLMGSIFTAVTYHELFKAAAFDGNSKLEFGLQWRSLFDEIPMNWGKAADEENPEEQKRMFDEIDEDGSGELDADELFACFQKMGTPIERGTVENLMRLSDADGSGTIDWEEFRRIFKAIKSVQTVPSKVKA